jgi:hypothetical protein
VRIDSTNPSDPRLPGDALAAARSAAGQAAPQVEQTALPAEYVPMAAQAAATADFDAEAVEQAKALLASGQLSSQQSIQRLAQKLIDLGI